MFDGLGMVDRPASGRLVMLAWLAFVRACRRRLDSNQLLPVSVMVLARLGRQASAKVKTAAHDKLYI